MRYLALACDYDGTLATNGVVDDATIAALERLRSTGRRLILVAGRQLEDLQEVFPHLDLFERVVVENGALLYRPATQEEKRLGEAPPREFIEALRQRDVTPLSVGRSIVATWHPQETTVLEVIEALGLELAVIFNKGAVMVLPPGVNKASGLVAALKELGLSPHNVVGVGDAENDHAFLNLCECSVAVGNALPMVKERADFSTVANRGAGVVELIEKLVADDLRELEPLLTRHEILLGTRDNGLEVRLKPYGNGVLIAGTSGSGKSTIATGILERLAERGYQFCLIDPEGDYENLESAIIIGSSDRPPSLDEVLQLLERPEENVVVNLLGLSIGDRPAFFDALFPRLQELRAQTGRPHWIVIDEAHHLLPATWDQASSMLPQNVSGILFITVSPEHVAPAALSTVDAVIGIGQRPDQTISRFHQALGQEFTPGPPVTLEPGEALLWLRQEGAEPVRIRVEPPQAESRRHRRKYAEGELGPDKSFYFRGPEGKLNLRAQNLMLFLQLAEGVDDQTWMYHLRQGDYSRWFREAIKDADLADEARRRERLPEVSPAESRAGIRAAIEARYTLPAKSSVSD
jgi:HAD superfamily hydrolase (TIGR01484 family)